MGATASLSVLLQAVTDKFDRKMKKSSSSVKQFGKQAAKSKSKLRGFGASITALAKGGLTIFVKSLSAKLLALGAAIASVVSVGSLVALTNQGLAAVDAMGKLSDKVGISTESLAGFGLAADLGGSSASTMAAALGRMVKRLGEFGQAGAGSAKIGLDILKLSFDDLKDLAPEDQFRLIADRIAALNSPLARAAAAESLFSRNGAELINVLAGGSAGLDEMQQLAEKLGLTFSRTDAAAAELANDSIDKLKKIVTGLSNQLAIKLSPAITAVVDNIRVWILEMVDVKPVVSDVVDFLVKGFGFVLDSIRVLRVAWNLFSGTVLSGIALILLPIDLLAQAGAALGLISDDTAKEFAIFRDAAVEQFAKAKELATDSWPSDKVKAFWIDAQFAANRAARNIAKNQTKALDQSADAFGDGLAEAADSALDDVVDNVNDSINDITIPDTSTKIQEQLKSGESNRGVFRFASSFGTGRINTFISGELKKGNRIGEDQLGMLTQILRSQEGLRRVLETGQPQPIII